MEKYKICPACGAHNNPMFLECSECETDLQNIPVVDEASEESATHAPLPHESMIRICEDCGVHNPAQARQCAGCGEDISMIIPTPEQAVTLRFILASLDGEYAYDICEGTTIIGREHEMAAYLESHLYVSRRHAELTLHGGILSVKNCSTTNFTYVNNQLLSGDATQILQDGDEIGLGGKVQNNSRQEQAAYFTVRICPCT